MNIDFITVGMLCSNCYIVSSDEKNAVVIDPGADFHKIKDYISENGLVPKKILLTHGHFDHIGAVAEMAEEYDPEVYIHEKDAPMLTDDDLNVSRTLGGVRHVEKYTAIQDGDVITLDELSFEVIATPGHTLGGVCYKCGDALFTGDTLFHMSMGRTDFPGGSVGEMYHSLKKLGALEGDYQVFPGHNQPTTLDYERKHNVCLKGNPYENSI